jgi:hypothetical protein
MTHNILSSKSAIIAELDWANCNLETGIYLLDESYFPWVVAGYLCTGEVVLNPLRNMVQTRDPISLEFYALRLTAAYRDRLVDYIAAIESRIESRGKSSIGFCFVWNKLKVIIENDSRFFQNLKESPSLQKETCKFRDSAGFEWGQLPLSPLEAPTPWPFPGMYSGKYALIYLIPDGEGYIITDKIMQLKVQDPFEGIEAARHWADYGCEVMVSQYKNRIPINITPYLETSGD